MEKESVLLQSYSRFADVYDSLMQDVDYSAWALYLHGLIKKSMPKAHTLLDCACGTGALSLRLFGLGYAVVGADNSGPMLMKAQEKARAKGAAIPFIQQDMRHLSLHRPVDVVTCACDGVNYLTDLEAVAAFLMSARRALKSGGLLLFDISSRHKLSTILGNRVFAETTGHCPYIWKNQHDEKTHLLAMELTCFLREAGGLYTRFDEAHLQRAHSETEIKEALCAAGFETIGCYGDFMEAPPKNDTERLQFVALRM